MVLVRLASGLAFAAGGVASRIGLEAHSAGLVLAGLVAATLGVWFFFRSGRRRALTG
jgi:membrane-associated phospholipid phosphatase